MAYLTNGRGGFGADADPKSTTPIHDLVDSELVRTGATAAMAYHGYKRTGSLAWALVYALAGRWFPLESVPIAVAQGFGVKKGCP